MVPALIEMGDIYAWRAFFYTNEAFEPEHFKRYHKGLNPLGTHPFEFPQLGLIRDTAPEPDIDNNYGFWSFVNKSDLVEYVSAEEEAHAVFRELEHERAIIYAVVKLSGDIVEHDAGWRSSEMEIMSMYAKRTPEARQTIGDDLGWPFDIQHIDTGLETFPATTTAIPQEEA